MQPPPAGQPTDATWHQSQAEALSYEASMFALKASLLRRSDEDRLDILMALAAADPIIKARIELGLRRIELDEKKKALEAEERRIKAAEKRMKTPINFEKLLDRVENYMYKEVPWSREASEAMRISNAIEKIFSDMVSRCGRQTPSAIKHQTLSTMIEMLEIIIDSPCSRTRKECVNDTYFKKESLDQLWGRLTLEEQYNVAIDRPFIVEFAQVKQKWAEHGIDDLLKDVEAGISDAVRQSRGEPWWVEESDGEAEGSTESTTQ
jgi:hypothetical protein